MKIIYFGPITNKILYPVFATLTSCIFFILDSFLKSFEKEQVEKYGTHSFENYFTMFIAESLALFIFFIEVKRTDRLHSKIPLQYKLSVKESPIKLIGFIILLSSLDLSTSLFDWDATINSNVLINVNRTN